MKKHENIRNKIEEEKLRIEEQSIHKKKEIELKQQKNNELREVRDKVLNLLIFEKKRRKLLQLKSFVL